MSAMLFTPWHSANSLRNYPFADHASRTSRQGVTIPQDVFVDLAVYPANATGALRISAIDGPAGLISFSDGSTVLATAVHVTGATEAVILEAVTPHRALGVVVFGAGADVFFNSIGTINLAGEAGLLTPGVVFPANQAGVRGIKLPDGTVVCGAVVFAGENGVEVVTSDEEGLRIDIVGATGTTVAECQDLPPAVRSIRVINLGTSKFAASKLDENTLGLTYRGGDIDFLCGNNDKFAPPSNPCDPQPPPEVLTPPDIVLDFALTDGRGFRVVAPSGIDYRNPISIEPIEHGIDIKVYGL